MRPLRRFISALAFLQDANMVLHAAGYTRGTDGGIMRDRDIAKIPDAIKYGVSPDEFADEILARDGFREPMNSAAMGWRS